MHIGPYKLLLVDALMSKKKSPIKYIPLHKAHAALIRIYDLDLGENGDDWLKWMLNNDPEFLAELRDKYGNHSIEYFINESPNFYLLSG
jgi:hypothetical protein